jgi:tripartite-type tricarboxylate transporter receptor subunit TctC
LFIAERYHAGTAKKSAIKAGTAAGVRKDIVDKLAGEIREVMKDPEVLNILLAEGAVPQVSPPPEEFKRFVDSEIARWGELVAKAGIMHSQ